MTERDKSFNIRRFVSVMTLCTFLMTGISGLVLLFSHGPGPSGAMINWKGMHEIACIFFAVFGAWHLVLNFKVLCRYFTGSRDGKLTFRMDWGIPVVIALLFFIMISFIPGERHGYQGQNSMEYSKGFRGHHR